MSSAGPKRSFLRRSTAALARDDGRLGWTPIIAALAIDLADVVGAGPIGLVLGGLLTTVVVLMSGARFPRALLLGVLGGLYCALPLTEAIPLATMLTLVHGFMLRKRHAAAQANQAQPTQDQPSQNPHQNPQSISAA